MAGRKTKYQGLKTNRRAFLLAKSGNTREQIAHNLGISKDTLYEWMSQPKKISFTDAIKKGEELAISHVENQLYKRAVGYSIIETKTIIGGTNPHTEEITKEIQPDVTAQIFLLKNKKPEEYKDRQAVEHSGQIGIINVPAVIMP
jgi:hypothetical protein